VGWEAGDPVLAGAVNGSGLLQVRVSRPFGESSLARIYRLVQESAGRKAPTERFMTTFARYYTPAVVGGALLLATIPPLVIPGAAFRTWPLPGPLVFLVISCPCALVISIPLGYLGGDRQRLEAGHSRKRFQLPGSTSPGEGGCF